MLRSVGHLRSTQLRHRPAPAMAGVYPLAPTLLVGPGMPDTYEECVPINRDFQNGRSSSEYSLRPVGSSCGSESDCSPRLSRPDLPKLKPST